MMQDSAGTVERLTAIIESAPTAMIMVDSGGKIVLLNRAAESMFGYARSELLGRPVEALVPGEFSHRHPKLRAGFVGDPSPRPMGAGRDLFAARKDGALFPVEIGLNPIQTSEGLHVLSVVVDLTERKRLENQLRQANEELEQRVQERTAQLARQADELQHANEALARSNQELQQFAYIASHDLQSPLRSISGFVQLLQSEYEGRLDAQADDWIRRTVEAIQQMQTLIRDILVYSRVDNRPQPFKPASFRAICDEAVAIHEGTIRDLSADVGCDEPMPVISGDSQQLVQLMQNLIGNALKYHGQDPPRIRISATHGEGEWVFCVRDNGIGIDPKYHERIFDIFRRLHDQKTYPGTGIGLAICRRVVQRHGGRIWVESEFGRGSTFCFTIPERTAPDRMTPLGLVGES